MARKRSGGAIRTIELAYVMQALVAMNHQETPSFSHQRIMKRHVYVLCILIILCAVSLGNAVGCGGSTTDDQVPAGEDAVTDEDASDEDALWGADDERESEFIYIDDAAKRGALLVRRQGEDIVIYDSMSSIVAESRGDNYYFSLGTDGIDVECDVEFIENQHLNMQCRVNGEECHHRREYVSGSYEELEDTCKMLVNRDADTEQDINESVTWKGNGIEGQHDEGVWQHACGRYQDSQPEICRNVVERHGIQYYYKTSCLGDTPPIISASGDISDNRDVLRVLRVYMEDEKEGCFLFVCNGPHGNLHMVILPYNKSFIDGSSTDIAERIRYGVSDAPVSYRTMLSGPYQKGDQCEWYETDDVGYQDVFYDDFVVWDWNNFCIGDRCPYKLMFVVYESDEEGEWGWLLGRMDDYVGYGIIRRGTTLDYDKSFYADKFKMAFRTYDYERPAGNEFVDERTALKYIPIEPFGNEYDLGIQGINDIVRDPQHENVFWISTFGMHSYTIPVNRVYRWDHNGTPFNFADDDLQDFSSHIIVGNDVDAAVDDMAVDDNGGIWFASGLHGMAYKRPDGTWDQTSDLFGGSYTSTGLWAIDIADDGTVYVGANGFVAKYDGRWEMLVVNAVGVMAVAAKPNCGLWFGPWSMFESGVYSVDCSGNLEKEDFFWEEGLNEGWVQSIFVESEDRVWFGTMDSGLYLWDLSDNTTHRFWNLFGEGTETFSASVHDLK